MRAECNRGNGTTLERKGNELITRRRRTARSGANRPSARSRTRRPGRSRLPTVLNWAGQILLGAAIVEALAVGMFGLVAGTFFVLLFLAAYVATFAAARRWVR